MEFDFSQHGEVADADFVTKVPEQFRGAYVKEGEVHKINPSLVGLTTAITGLNGALRKERTTVGTLKGQKDVGAAVTEALGELGISSLEEAKARIGELTATVAEKGKVDPAKIKADIEKTFTAERDGLNAKNAKMKGTLERYLVDSAATAALAAAKGNVKLLLPVIKQSIAVVEDGEDFVVRVKDAQGDYRGNGAGGFMSVEDLVKELKASPDYGVAFASEQAPGSGRPATSRQAPGSVQRQQQTQEQRENRSSVQRISDGIRARRNGN